MAASRLNNLSPLQTHLLVFPFTLFIVGIAITATRLLDIINLDISSLDISIDTFN